MPRLDHFGVVTAPCTAQPELMRCANAEGAIGLLLGAPIEQDRLPDGARLVMLQLLTQAEYRWVIGVEDSSRAHVLVQAFQRSGIKHFSSPVLPSLKADA